MSTKPIFNPRSLTIGVRWRWKPRSIWIYIPLFEPVHFQFGKLCPVCDGAGGFVIDAGDTCSYDECETCSGKGVVK